MKSWGLVSLLGIAALALDAGSLPGSDDPAVQAHLAKKSALLAEEKLQRQDHEFRSALSPAARQAEAIVAAIRQDEIDHFWRRPGPLGNEDAETFAGAMFPKAKHLIPDTKLWRIVSHMPKGALLHVHFPAFMPFASIFDSIIDTEGMVVVASRVVEDEIAARNASVRFGHVNGTTALVGYADTVSISSDEYQPGTPVPIAQAAANYPGGRGGFVAFLLSKVTLSDAESVRHDLGVDAIWRSFQSTFATAGSALTYEPVVRTFYRRLFEALVDDGIDWVEIRAGGASPGLVHEGDEAPDPDLDAWWRVMEEELEKFRSTNKGRGFWGVKIIWSDIRSFDRPTLVGNMEKALQLKQHFPDLFGGYDLVAQEDLGRPLSDLAPELLWFRDRAAALNLTYPFFFHAGETLGDGNATDDNMFDALLLDSRRIGHGFSLYKHPLLLRVARENRVLMEVCPISEEVLRLSTDILHHPLPAMIAHGVATAISNDDPSVWQDAPGLSYDFFQVIQGFDNIGLGGLGALVQNSIRWANFEDQSKEAWIRDIDLGTEGTGLKARRMREWQDKWEAFCQWIVDEYGASAGDS